MKKRKAAVLVPAIIVTLLIAAAIVVGNILASRSEAVQSYLAKSDMITSPVASVTAAVTALTAGLWIVVIRKLNRGAAKQGLGKAWVVKAFLLAFADSLIAILSYLAALLIRFDFDYRHVPLYYLRGYVFSLPYMIIITVAVFFGFRLYHSIWKLASVAELSRLIGAHLVLIPLIFAGAKYMRYGAPMPRSFYFIGYVLTFCFTIGIRFSYRFVRFFIDRKRGRDDSFVHTMLIGGGSAGQTLIKEIQRSRDGRRVCCIIDDNPNKTGRLLEGIPIVGNRESIPQMAKKYEITEIIIAIPSISPLAKKDLLHICKETSCRVKIIPGVDQIVNGEVSVTKLRDVDISDLLGRDQVSVNNDEILKSIKGKTVLVTGGGGSIGSELCRQIARSEPERLVIFDIYENNAYDIQQELLRDCPGLALTVLIGSVRNTNRINSVMKTYRPDIVFHAAAHKHVPLMETSPDEAIKNNVFGTLKTAQAAARCGVSKFVLISTDKAVNPTNIMGASKRICEMIVQMMNRKYPETDFVAVRFGNVLGSNGSVIPLFKKQIAHGGPVTVTDKNIIRHFMTIPEAVSLVLQASYYADGGEIFVLDMGDPVRIDDMARNLIRLSGYVPDEDIMIEYTGLRPGEKLYEELLMDEEGLRSTDNKLIHIGHPIKMDDDVFSAQLSRLADAAYNESEDICSMVEEIVPTYHPYRPAETAKAPAADAVRTAKSAAE